MAGNRQLSDALASKSTFKNITNFNLTAFDYTVWKIEIDGQYEGCQ